jgi:hypothetical protein
MEIIPDAPYNIKHVRLLRILYVQLKKILDEDICSIACKCLNDGRSIPV